jgi:hypothetical protein
MPSAEKPTSAATTLESTPLIEPKGVENTPNENAQDEKTASSIPGMLSIVSNKVRNLEKRKVSNAHTFWPFKAELLG